MHLISWNVNGIRAVLRKNRFLPFVTASDPDVICLQETKAHPQQVELDLPSHPYQYWHSAEKKGYAGTAIFAKHEPLSVSYGLGLEAFDSEGRLVAAEFDDLYAVSVYVPNSKRDLSRLDERQDWDRAFLSHLKDLEQRKPVVFSGDFNVAHTEIDLARPKDNEGHHGYTREERSGFDNFVSAGFIDTFRSLYPDARDQYTWWRQMGGARERNVGWRIDYVMISAALLPRLESASILSDVYGSDHCPVGIQLRR